MNIRKVFTSDSTTSHGVKIYTIILLFVSLSCIQSQAQDKPTEESDILLEDINSGNPKFYGLAAYYNGIQIYLADSTDIIRHDLTQLVELKKGEHAVFLGRTRALVVSGDGTKISVKDNVVKIVPSHSNGTTTNTYFSERSQLGIINPELLQLRYTGLWGPFTLLAWAVEWLLITIKSILGISWGWSILILALVVKIILLPLSILTLRSQQKVSQFQSKLEPILAEIKANYKGEQAHNKVMAAHKKLGISPLFTLKPLLATLIQIPVLIAIFNALGEMPQLMGISFLWIKDLSFHDSIATLPFTVPLFGNSLNLLPLLMTMVSITSTLLFRNHHAPPREVQKQKRNLFFMSAAFLVLFYPFPASMVLYWTVSNALHIVQQRILGS